MRAKWPWFLFFIAVAFAFYGMRPLGEPDEGRYAETAREMLVSGNWLVPQLQGEPHLTKPPLAYWSMAAGMRWLGINEWGARLPLALAFFLTILCVVELARTWGMGATASLAAGIIFSTALLPFVCGHLLTTDMILTFWETLGILALWKVWRGAAAAFLWRWVFWLAFAAAFLTKGPPGWLPLLAVVIFRAASRMHRPQRRVFSVLAAAAFVVLSFSWYVAVILRIPGLLDYYLKNELVGRVLTNTHERGKPWWFYPLVLTFGLTPWIFLWPALIRRTLLDIKPELADRGAFPSFTKLRASVSHYWEMSRVRGELHFFAFLWAMVFHSVRFLGFKLYHFWHRLRRIEDIKFFSFLWFFVPLAVFAISKSKMFFYVVPLYVPLAIWSGHLLAKWRPSILPPEPRVRRWVYLGAAVWSLAAGGFLLFPEHPRTTNSHRQLSRLVRDHYAGIRLNQLYALEGPRNSISFYSGLLITELNEGASSSLRYLRGRHAGKTEPAVLVLKKSKMKKLGDSWFKVIADDGEVVVLEVTPPPPALTMKP